MVAVSAETWILAVLSFPLGIALGIWIGVFYVTRRYPS